MSDPGTQPPEPPFICKICGEPTLIAPGDGSPAVCPEHCEDHQYIYEPGTGHICGNCGAPPPDDWFMIDC